MFECLAIVLSVIAGCIGFAVCFGLVLGITARVFDFIFYLGDNDEL